MLLSRPPWLSFSAAAAPRRESGRFCSEPLDEPRQQPIVAGRPLQPIVRLLCFFPLVLTVLLTSRFVLSGSSARSCFCVSLHLPLCVQIPRASTPTPAVPGYLRFRCGRLSLSLGFASSLASFNASAAVTARPAVVIELSAWQRILPLSDCPRKHSSPVYYLLSK